MINYRKEKDWCEGKLVNCWVKIEYIVLQIVKQISLKQEVLGEYDGCFSTWKPAESNQICQRCRILKDTYKMLSSWNQDAVIVLTKGKDSECINTLLDIKQSTKEPEQIHTQKKKGKR